MDRMLRMHEMDHETPSMAKVCRAVRFGCGVSGRAKFPAKAEKLTYVRRGRISNSGQRVMSL
jgi:hypothetical protein